MRGSCPPPTPRTTITSSNAEHCDWKVCPLSWHAIMAAPGPATCLRMGNIQAIAKTCSRRDVARAKKEPVSSLLPRPIAATSPSRERMACSARTTRLERAPPYSCPRGQEAFCSVVLDSSRQWRCHNTCASGAAIACPASASAASFTCHWWWLHNWRRPHCLHAR